MKLYNKSICLLYEIIQMKWLQRPGAFEIIYIVTSEERLYMNSYETLRKAYEKSKTVKKKILTEKTDQTPKIPNESRDKQIMKHATPITVEKTHLNRIQERIGSDGQGM